MCDKRDLIVNILFSIENLLLIEPQMGGVRNIKLNKQYERNKLQNIKKNPSFSGSYQFTKEENYFN